MPETVQRISRPHPDRRKDEHENSDESNRAPKLFPHHVPGLAAGLGERFQGNRRNRRIHMIFQCWFQADRVVRAGMIAHQKLWGVLADRNHDPKGVVSALLLVVFGQSLAKAMYFNADTGVFALFEVLRL